MAKGIYVGALTHVYGEDSVSIDNSSLSTYFTVTNGSNAFTWNSDEYWYESAAPSSGIATMTLVAKQAMEIRILGECDVYPDIDVANFSLTINGVTKFKVTGTERPEYEGELSAGDTLVISYVDGDGDPTYYCLFFGTIVPAISSSSRARKVTNIYVGASTPIYEDIESTIAVTADNISTFFDQSNQTYYFAASGSSFISNNYRVSSSTANSTWTALMDMEVAFDYSVSSETKYDKFSIYKTDTSNYVKYIANGISGTQSNSSTISLSKGDKLTLEYTKDSSGNTNNDEATISNIYVTAMMPSYKGDAPRARRVVKGYIGIGGVARPFWGSSSSMQYGLITALSTARCEMSSLTVGGCALFAGGGENRTSNNDIYSTVEAYDSTLTKVFVNYLLDSAKADPATAVIANQGIVITSTKANIFDTSLTRRILPVSDSSIGAGVNTSNLALFISHSGFLKFDSSLTETMTNVSFPMSEIHTSRDTAATGLSNVALFHVYDKIGYTIDNSMTYTRIDFSDYRQCCSATSVDSYAMFAGGYKNLGGYIYEGSNSSVDVFNTSLTRTLAPELSYPRHYTSAASTHGLALFSEGISGGSMNSVNYVDIYDGNLTKVAQYIPTVAQGSYQPVRCKSSAAAVGNYILVAGGYGTWTDGSSYQSNQLLNRVEAYEIS